MLAFLKLRKYVVIDLFDIDKDCYNYVTLGYKDNNSKYKKTGDSLHKRTSPPARENDKGSIRANPPLEDRPA